MAKRLSVQTSKSPFADLVKINQQPEIVAARPDSAGRHCRPAARRQELGPGLRQTDDLRP